MRLFATVLRRGDFHGARIDLSLPQRAPTPRADIRQYRIGVGPVAVFGVSNFPLAFSTAGGDTAAALAAGCPVVFKAQPIPVFAEMSSINPVVLLPEALQVRGAQVADELAASVLLGAGQFCTNPGLVIGVRSSGFNTFVHRLCQTMDKAAPQTMLNAGGLAHYGHGLQAMLAHPGVVRLAGGEQVGAQARAQVFKADAGLLLRSDPLLRCCPMR